MTFYARVLQAVLRRRRADLHREAARLGLRPSWRFETRREPYRTTAFVDRPRAIEAPR